MESICRAQVLLILACRLAACITFFSSVSLAEVEDFDSIKLYTLKNESGMTVRATNYGAIITSIIVPDETET